MHRGRVLEHAQASTQQQAVRERSEVAGEHLGPSLILVRELAGLHAVL